MKYLFLLILILTTSVGVAEAQAKKDSRNVMDYYKLLAGSGELVTNGTKITVSDVENGYLEVRGDEIKRNISLFRKASGAAIVVVAEYDCFFVCKSQLESYELDTSELDLGIMSSRLDALPRLSNRERLAIFNRKLAAVGGGKAKTVKITHQLPRNGKVIKVLGSKDGKKQILLYELHLEDDMFVIVRK